MDTITESAPTISAGAYFRMIARMATRPAAVYEELSESGPQVAPLSFLLVSSLVFAAGSMIQADQNPLFTFLVAFLHAVALTALASAYGHVLVKILSRRRTRFGRTFSIYALASGTVLLAAWLPALSWFAEITRWLFIGIGLVRAGGLGKGRAALVVLGSLGLVFVTTWGIVAAFAAFGV